MKIDLPTFAGGEISPEVIARYDTAKYRTALARARNVLMSTTGGVYMRPGLMFAGRVYDPSKKTRVIPWQFSVDQGYALELGHHSLRFYYQGGLVVQTDVKVTGITNANPAYVTSPAHGNTLYHDVYFSGIGGMTQINGRIARIIAIPDADHYYIDLDTSGFGAFTSSTGVDGAANGGVGGDPPPPADPPPPPFENTTEPPIIISPEGFGGFFY